jgi:RimJ/RimL family protein N-acetyltransferase
VLRTSEDTDVADVQPLLPEADAVLDPPGGVARVDGEAAAVWETARSAPRSGEAGVWTYEAHRRRGLATLVTSAWLDLVTPDRTAFYSTSADNLGSQGVARRLGLTSVAQWWQVR